MRNYPSNTGINVFGRDRLYVKRNDDRFEFNNEVFVWTKKTNNNNCDGCQNVRYLITYHIRFYIRLIVTYHLRTEMINYSI